MPSYLSGCVSDTDNPCDNQYQGRCPQKDTAGGSMAGKRRRKIPIRTGLGVNYYSG